MQDAAASRMCCRNDAPQSILVDDTYPDEEERIEFIKPHGREEHRRARSVVERYFGQLKRKWKLVGRKFSRDARWHSLAIRAAFILTNMVIVRNGGLNK